MNDQWWQALEPAWQDVFRVTLGYDLTYWGDHVPTAEELATLAVETKVNASHSKITSLAPLGALTRLEHVDFGGCKQLTSYDGLPPSVRSVSFYWIEPAELAWLDALPNLEQVWCDSPLQATLRRRLTARRRKRT